MHGALLASLLFPLAFKARSAAPQAKITGAALAAAFASAPQNDAREPTLEEKEERVIRSIREGLNAGIGQPRRLLDSLGEFGQASGVLAQTWLTPQQLERCAVFWSGGATLVGRDVRRGKVSLTDLKATPWFGLLALNSFPWTPLLVPLVARAVSTNGTGDAESVFVPGSFSARRLEALMRLRGDTGLASDVDAPQNIDEGVRFFADGGRMLLRDWRRGRFSAYGDATSTYAWFALLSLSTFPLTPLLLPSIDKRRPQGAQADYVPASFRSRRLAAFARRRDALAAAACTPPSVTIHAAAAAAEAAAASAHGPSETVDEHGRPSAAALLDAIVALPATAVGRDRFLDRLAGGGPPGRRWLLVYTAGKDAVKEARQRRKDGRGGAAAPWLTSLQRRLLPWTHLADGLYVDELLTAVQRFDETSGENENGVFGLLGNEWVQFSVTGPFRWPQPERRAVCAFQPTSARCRLGALEWEWSVSAGEPASTPSFELAPVTSLPFFKFLLVDERVAVAQGRSGGVALWARID